MKLKKLLIISGIALVVWFVVTEPQTASDLIWGAIGLLENLARGIIDFLKELANGGS